MPQPAAPPRGLSLIELVIALAVLAVLGALAVPTMGKRLEHQRLQHAAEALAGDIAEARFEAARAGQAWHLQGSAGDDWCWAVARAPDCGCGEAAGCQVHRVAKSDHPGVRLLDAFQIRLDPSGTAASQTSATLGSAHGDRLRVEVSVLGRTRICAASGEWPRMPVC